MTKLELSDVCFLDNRSEIKQSIENLFKNGEIYMCNSENFGATVNFNDNIIINPNKNCQITQLTIYGRFPVKRDSEKYTIDFGTSKFEIYTTHKEERELSKLNPPKIYASKNTPKSLIAKKEMELRVKANLEWVDE